jgi:hypothetical protein
MVLKDQRQEKMEQIANKLLKGGKANVAKAVFLLLLSKADNATNTSSCPIPALSECLGYSENWIKVAINLYIKAGLISKVGRGGRGSMTIYKINYQLIGEQKYQGADIEKKDTPERTVQTNTSN